MTNNPNTIKPFPVEYALTVRTYGDAGEFNDGDLAKFDTRELPARGDVVVLHCHDGRALLVTMESAILEPHWKAMPFREHPDSTAHAAVTAKRLGSDEQMFGMKLEDLRAIHKCVGKLDQAA